ncbi:helix-turn-helix domain-containing protein, partial [Pseudonocardia sp. NPDC049154]|uniref:helix-turn-helix domain-containing protein n=1 Tax=Pseudonocardia sp. NPDC049154 TaxID=3155501 RepID=UPI0033F59934
MGSAMMMADDTLFDDPDVDRPDPAERKNVRRHVLGGLVQIIRARRGWSVNDAASAASVAPMTWRRVEDGLDVRQRTLTALDGLLGVQFGTVKRALDDDLVMLELVDLVDIGVGMDEALADPAGTLAALAERFRTGSAPRQTIANAGVAEGGGQVGTPTVRQGTGRAAVVLSGRGELSAGRRKAFDQVLDPALLESLAAVSVPNPSTITLAAQLVDRLTRLPAMTEGIEHAVASILA